MQKKINNSKFKKFLKVYWGILIIIISLALFIGFGILGFGAYKYTVDHNGQFLNQPVFVIINFDPNISTNIGDVVTDGGQEGQLVGLVFKPFFDNISLRFLFAILAILFLLIMLITIFVTIFTFINFVKMPQKKIKRYDDASKLNVAKKSNLIKGK